MSDQSKDLLIGLKNFQKRTVDFVFERLYGENSTRRFLVADEVGLGKTMVARGLIAKAIDRLSEKSDRRIDVIYICSNVSIANQNIDSLNVTGNDENREFATRMTYLPVDGKKLKTKDITFIPLTPQTTFDHSGSQGGDMKERAIIYQMLLNLPWGQGTTRKRYQTGFLNMMQVGVQLQNWRPYAASYHINDDHPQINGKKDPEKPSCNRCIDSEIAIQFRKDIREDPSSLYFRLKDCAWRYRRYRKNIPIEDRNLRNEIIASLRHVLAKTCIELLEPDLIILDEFQRFSDLLKGESEASRLALDVFNYQDAKVLLLSATPYKMLTMNSEALDEKHYEEFIETLAFLYDDATELSKLKRDLSQWRTVLQSGENMDSKGFLKDALQAQLMKVMCRTERVNFTKNLNSMVENTSPDSVSILPEDLLHGRVMDQISVILNTGNLKEYWKSAPYLLNYLRDYKFREVFDSLIKEIDTNGNALQYDALKSLLKQAEKHILQSEKLERYDGVDPGNPRLRYLITEMVDSGLWRCIWMPPSLPYSKPAGVYANMKSITKSVVFSSWKAVPDAIATLVSYEVERRMLGDSRKHTEYRYDSFSSPLDYTKAKLLLSWTLPMPTLSVKIDPLRIALETGDGDPIPINTLRLIAKREIHALLESVSHLQTSEKRDFNWYWIAPVLFEGDEYRRWLEDLMNKPESLAIPIESNKSRGVQIEQLIGYFKGDMQLGAFPTDLEMVLADLALGAPGTCTFRSLSRVQDEEIELYNQATLTASFIVAEKFRSIFGSREVVMMLNSQKNEVRGKSYIKRTLDYNIKGNIQAVLDEHTHLLAGTPGMLAKNHTQRMKSISDHYSTVLSITSATVQIDSYQVKDEKIVHDEFRLRTRFALRYSDIREDQEKSVIRASSVKDAFNSPFRPFVLASTSIGQEGLDFHPWCHAVVHWNLPTNPVDLEQREGRVHRYKGHAIRKNIAECYGLAVLKLGYCTGDPWEYLFQHASNLVEDDSGLIPYWIFEEGSSRVERRIPILPFSAEEHRLPELIANLAVYRLAFGQPRQEDLLVHLRTFSQNEDQAGHRYLISLAPG